VIFTNDPVNFRSGRYVEMYDEMDTLPTSPSVTFIYHNNKFKEKDALSWLPLIGHRLVIVCDKKPTIKSKDQRIIIDSNFKRDNPIRYNRQIRSFLSWSDRHRVFLDTRDIPVPVLMNQAIANNLEPMDSWRLFYKAGLELPEEYSRAILCFGMNPTNSDHNNYKKRKVEETPPPPFRANDRYWKEIINNGKEDKSWL
jgi:hypothetical protein